MIGAQTLVYDGERSEAVFPRTAVINEVDNDGMVGLTITSQTTRDCDQDGLGPIATERRVPVYTAEYAGKRELLAKNGRDLPPLPVKWCTDPRLPIAEQQELFSRLIDAPPHVREAVKNGRTQPAPMAAPHAAPTPQPLEVKQAPPTPPRPASADPGPSPRTSPRANRPQTARA